MSITYRKDIDGLRAVAVILVILAHAKFSFIEGGFVGVDVFFVISGYLITSILKREMDSGTFSLSNFYLRRIRRIMPALTCVVILTAVASLFILYPVDFYLFSKSAVSGLTAWANIFFSSLNGGYWGQDVSLMPLAHLWSLAVEEQFYILWPLILFSMIKWLPKQLILKVVFLLWCVLFVVSVWQSSIPEGYYSLSARAFEILLGALIALVDKEQFRVENRFISFCCSCVGVVLIITSALLLPENVSFPGWNALWPCLGAGCLIWPKASDDVVTRFLESAAMTFLGRISYSLYLWHWPIFALLIYRWNSLDGLRIWAIVASVLLASGSYFFIEQPLRTARFSSVRTVVFLFVIPVCSVVLISQGARFTNGFEGRFSGKELAVLSDTYRKLQPCSLQEPDGAVDSLCVWGAAPSEQSIDVLLVGDSHARSIRGFVEALTSDAHLTGRDVSQNGVPYLKGLSIYDLNDDKIVSVDKYNQLVAKLMGDSLPQYVIIAGRYSGYLLGYNEKDAQYAFYPSDSGYDGRGIVENKKLFVDSFKRAFTAIIAKGIIPVLIKDVPEMGRDVSREGVRAALGGFEPMGISLQAVEERQAFANQLIDELAREYPQTIVIDPKDVLCRKGKCYSALDGVPLYRDDDHLNYRGSKLLGEKYLQQFGNPFK